jgi:hypothetical protein
MTIETPVGPATKARNRAPAANHPERLPEADLPPHDSLRAELDAKYSALCQSLGLPF